MRTGSRAAAATATRSNGIRRSWRTTSRTERCRIEAAAAQYGVVIGGDDAVDTDATERLRAERRSEVT